MYFEYINTLYSYKDNVEENAYAVKMRDTIKSGRNKWNPERNTTINYFIHFVHACPNVLPVIQSYFKHNSDLLKKQPIAALVLLFFKHVLIYHTVHSDLLFIYQSDIL